MSRGQLRTEREQPFPQGKPSCECDVRTQWIKRTLVRRTYDSTRSVFECSRRRIPTDEVQSQPGPAPSHKKVAL
jgi:hypothetical protein